jgi:hypothetical protein
MDDIVSSYTLGTHLGISERSAREHAKAGHLSLIHLD